VSSDLNFQGVGEALETDLLNFPDKLGPFAILNNDLNRTVLSNPGAEDYLSLSLRSCRPTVWCGFAQRQWFDKARAKIPDLDIRAKSLTAEGGDSLIEIRWNDERYRPEAQVAP